VGFRADGGNLRLLTTTANPLTLGPLGLPYLVDKRSFISTLEGIESGVICGWCMPPWDFPEAFSISAKIRAQCLSAHSLAHDRSA
jgi:hypothetical protein